MSLKPKTLLVCFLSYALALGLTVELAARTSYHVRKPRLSFWLPASQFVYRFYPALQQAVKDGQHSTGPRVLVLAASTLHPDFSDVAARLQRGLEAAWGTPVQVENLSVPGHGVLDSYYKYRSLQQAPFDLVLVYHGINELRANNIPPTLWKDDYSHYWWYDEVNFYFRHPRLVQCGFLAPFFLKHVLTRLDRTVLRPWRFVGDGAPRSDWLVYGAQIKTARPFRRDLERVVRLAASKGDPVLLMTFAYALPESYTSERLRAGTLGFVPSPNASPVELWGSPPSIREGLEAHNQVIKAVAAAHGVPLVDQDALLQHDPALFIDVCHLSPAGAERFAGNILAAVASRQLRPRAMPSQELAVHTPVIGSPIPWLKGLRRRGLKLPKTPVPPLFP